MNYATISVKVSSSVAAGGFTLSIPGKHTSGLLLDEDTRLSQLFLKLSQDTNSTDIFTDMNLYDWQIEDLSETNQFLYLGLSRHFKPELSESLVSSSAFSSKALATVAGISPIINDAINRYGNLLCSNCGEPQASGDLSQLIEELSAKHSDGILLLGVSPVNIVSDLEFGAFVERQHISRVIINGAYERIDNLPENILTTSLNNLESEFNVGSIITDSLKVPAAGQSINLAKKNFNRLPFLKSRAASLFLIEQKNKKIKETFKFLDDSVCVACGSKLPTQELDPNNRIRLHNIELNDLHSMNFEEIDKVINELPIDDTFKETIREISSVFCALGFSDYNLNRDVSNFSHDEVSRLRIAQALLLSLSGVVIVIDRLLDSFELKEVQEVIDFLNKSGHTIVILSHNLNLINLLSKKVELTGHHSLTFSSIKIDKTDKGKDSLVKLKVSNGDCSLIGELDLPNSGLINIRGRSGAGKSYLLSQVIPKLVKSAKQIKLKTKTYSTLASESGLYELFIEELVAIRDARLLGLHKESLSQSARKSLCCPDCRAVGLQFEIKSNHISNVVECERCKGIGVFAPATDILLNGITISKFFNLTVNNALVYFKNYPALNIKLQELKNWGFGSRVLRTFFEELTYSEKQRLALLNELSLSKNQKINRTLLVNNPTYGLSNTEALNLSKMFRLFADQDNLIITADNHAAFINSADKVIRVERKNI